MNLPSSPSDVTASPGTYIAHDDIVDTTRCTVALLLVSSALLACEEPCDGDTDMIWMSDSRDFACAEGAAPPCRFVRSVRSSDERTVCARGRLDAQTRSYAVSRFAPPTREEAFGRDMDELDSGPAGSMALSATCEAFQPDIESADDPPRPGVDNALLRWVPNLAAVQTDCPGGRVNGCVSAQLAEDLAERRLSGVVELDGLDDWRHDPEVDVLLELAVDGAPTVQMRGVGEVFDGELLVALGDATIPSGAAAFDGLPRELRGVQLRGEVTEERLAVALSGWTPVDAYVDQLVDNGTADGFAEYGRGLRDLFGQPPREETTPRELLRDLLLAVADLDPSPTATDFCRGLSFGYRLEASAVGR